MRDLKIKRLLLPLALSAALLLTGCGGTATALLPSTTTAKAETAVTQEDTQTTWDDATAVHVTLSETAADVSGSGASYESGSLTITEAGTYVLTGTLQGTILIDAGKNDTVRLVLNGVTVTASSGSALYEKKAAKVILTMAEGTVNSFTDASIYVLAEGETEPDAALYAQNSLTINGTGSLTVTGNANHGIVSKDDLIIAGGTLSVTAAGTGIRGRDSLTILDGDITVNATGDALQANNDEDSTKGTILISGGTFRLTAGKDGIQAETTLTITDGTFDITSGGYQDSTTAANIPSMGGMPTGGDQTGTPPSGAPPTGDTASGDMQTDNLSSGGTSIETVSTDTVSSATMSQNGRGGFPSQMGGNGQTVSGNTSEDSGKGLKATGGLTIEGGTFVIRSADDTIHTNGDAVISGGTFTLTSGDDGIHADGTATIQGGDITVVSSYEGLEAANILVEGGTLDITASDDGFNAAGGNDGSSVTNDWRGQGAFQASGDYSIRISGGTMTVNANGDAFDSNGNIYMSGGTVYADGPTTDGNGAIDYNGVFELTGGTIVASGSSGMAENVSSVSGQAALMVYGSFSGSIALKDSSGNTLIATTPTKAYQSIVFSAPTMQKGLTYTLVINGETVAEITLSSDITTYSTDGTQGGTFNQQFPGGQNNFGGPGGGRQRR